MKIVTYQLAQNYLKSRQGEEPSVVSAQVKSQVSHMSASRKAEVALQMKQLEVKQLVMKHQRKKEEQEIHRKNELQNAKDSEELAKLEAHLMVTAEDGLNWDQRKDFDDEAGVVRVNAAELQKRSEDHHPADDLNPQNITAVQDPPREVPDQEGQHASVTDPQSESLFVRSLPRITLPKFSDSPGE